MKVVEPSMAEAAEAYFEDHRESNDLGRRALRGGLVSIVIQYGNAALQIAAAIILARLLAPEDFGLVAIVTVLTSFAPLLIDFGLLDATAQRSRITPAQVSGLFFVSCGLGLAVAVVVAACSPLIAWVYGEPRLQPIALSIAITFVLSGMSNQHIALLRRAMQFGRIARIQFFGTLAGTAVAVVVAICGYGYWALVLRPITTSFCVVFGAWSACRWRPRIPVLDDEVKSMVRFGLHVVGFTVAYTLSRAVDRIALGLFYRPDQVGYYQNAMNLYDNSIFGGQSDTRGGKFSPQQTSIQSRCASKEIRSGVVHGCILRHADGGNSFSHGRGLDRHFVGGKVADGRFTPEYNCVTGRIARRRRLAGLAASFHRERGPLAKLGNHIACGAGRGGSCRSAVRPPRSRHRSGRGKFTPCCTVDNLCGPSNRHWRCTCHPGRGPAADRRNQYRGRRLVAAGRNARRLFRLHADFTVVRILHLHLSCHSCRLVSAYRAD
jgi:hypothetical protein